MSGAYIGLFFAAFGAATLLPLQSEAVLVGLLLKGQYWLWSLLAVATLGNVLGSVVNCGWDVALSGFATGAGFRSARALLKKPDSIINATVIGHCC